jgi:general nucleoside transport system ATP-binding protein
MENTPKNAPSVRMTGIVKRFPGVVANDHVDFLARTGDITALVGENGAGKSTLMNVLYGLHRPDEGEMFLQGEPVDIQSPNDAIKAGIGMVHQHFMLSPELSILDNVVLGHEPRNWIFTDRRRARSEVLQLMHNYHFDLMMDVKIKNLPVGLKQQVEILKLLYRGANILILDEPTAVLTPQETRELFSNLRDLTQQGKAIIFITHKLDEVMAISDQVYVMRSGKMVDHLPTHETNAREIAELMVGRELIDEWQKETPPGEKPVLKVNDLIVNDDQSLRALQRLSLDVREGEILGVAGVAGNGQAELAQSLVGLRHISEGMVVYKGQDINDWSRRKIQTSGIGYIPDDRTDVALCLEWSVKQNLVAGKHFQKPFVKGPFQFLDDKKIESTAEALKTRFDIRLQSVDAAVRSLSGGNQQKVVLAREIYEVPELLIAFEPTRGVDVGAIEFIYQQLLALRKKGTSILLISSDLDEILALSDRIAVIFRGKIIDTILPQKATREEIGLLMAGKKSEGD